MNTPRHVGRAEVIGTERLELLPLRVEYVDEMAGVLGDPAVRRWPVEWQDGEIRWRRDVSRRSDR